MRLLATAGRVLSQLRRDPRTVAMMVLLPMLLVGLFAWIMPARQFAAIGPILIALFPFVVMFIVTSIATLRERTSGTLERLLTTPLRKAELLFGYEVAFGLVALVQAILVVAFAVYVCGLDIAGSLWVVGGMAVLNALMGTALGLLASAFARTEFQASSSCRSSCSPRWRSAASSCRARRCPMCCRRSPTGYPCRTRSKPYSAPPPASPAGNSTVRS